MIKRIFLFIGLTIFCSHFIFAETTIPKIHIGDWSKVTILPSRTFAVTLQYTSSTPAEKVNIAGSFNGWSPSGTLLDGPDKNGVWKITLHLIEDTYQYKFVVNGDQWIQDLNNPNKEDD